MCGAIAYRNSCFSDAKQVHEASVIIINQGHKTPYAKVISIEIKVDHLIGGTFDYLSGFGSVDDVAMYVVAEKPAWQQGIVDVFPRHAA